MDIRKIMWLISLTLLVFSFSCSLSRSPAGIPEKPVVKTSVANEAPSNEMEKVSEGWQMKWDRLLVAAKKEGKVVFYCSAGQAVRDNVSREFQKATGIQVEITTGGMPELAARIFAEHRAGLYLADILTGGVTTSITRLKPGGVLQPMEPVFILPELTDPELIKKTWLDGTLPWVDPQSKLIFAMLAYPSPPVTINTNLGIVNK